jgi:hypothetical protein
MQKWMYLDRQIHFDSRKDKWVDRTRNLEETSLGMLLNSYGAEGWELVSCDPYVEESISESAGYSSTIKGYIAIFKQPGH